MFRFIPTLLCLATAAGSADLFPETFNPPLTCNEWAHYRPADVRGKHCRDFFLTNGSLFSKEGLWSGVPDFAFNAADPYSRTWNKSCLLRAWTKRTDFGNVRIVFQARVNAFSTSCGEPKGGDGLKIGVRVRPTDYNYGMWAHVMRRDETVKMEVEKGNLNYAVLDQSRPSTVYIGKWQTVRIEVRNASNGVNMKVFLSGVLVMDRTDTGYAGAPLFEDGRIAIRSDCTDWNIRDLQISPL
jgi:hypothetical protein